MKPAVPVVQTLSEQLERWLDGDYTHANGQCCPDFGCCNPDARADRKTREAFVAGNEGVRHGFLMLFLGNAIAARSPEKRVYIAGEGPPS